MSKSNINKEEIKNLIVEYHNASVECKAAERAARDARAVSDNLKSQLLSLHRMGVTLKSGKLSATITETPREAYTVKASTRVSVVVEGL